MIRVPLLRLLAPLTVVSSTLAAQAPTSVGLDTAGMDRDVKPGDAFFEYANGSWLRRTEIPADRSTYGASAILIEQTDRKVADLIRDPANAQAPAGSDLRRVADYYAAFLDTTAIEAAGLAPLRPTLDSHRGHPRPPRARPLPRLHAARRRRRAEQHQFLHRRTCSASGWRRTWTIPRSTSPFLLQGGLGMPDRDYYLDAAPRWPGSATSTRSTSQRCCSSPAWPTRTRKAARIVALEKSIAARALEPGAIERRAARATTTGPARSFAPRRRGSTGRPSSARPASRRRPSSWCGSPARSPGSPSWSAPSRWTTWKDYLTFHAHPARGGGLPAVRRRSRSPSTDRC